MPSIRLIAAFGGLYARWLAGGLARREGVRWKDEKDHRQDVSRLQEALRAGQGPFRLGKRGPGHQARADSRGPGAVLDVRSLDAVLEVDQDGCLAVVEPQVTMNQLVDILAPFDLAPCVIPEFSEITVGGAIQGLGAESSSHRFGLFHEAVEWMEVVLGDGSVLRVSPGEHPDLWRAIPGSYGSLAIVTLVCMRLQTRTDVVEVHHRRVQSCDFLASAVPWGDDFVDAIEVGDGETIVTTANRCEKPPAGAYLYRSGWPRPYFCDHVRAAVDAVDPDFMAFEEYVFRYDRGAFWVASTKLGSSFLSRVLFSGFATAENLYRLREAKRRYAPAPSRRLVQDCIVPARATSEFLSIVREFVHGPLWLLPIRSKADNLFGLKPGNWMNFGIYVRLERPFAEVEDCNRRLESELTRLGGLKTLHADNFFDRPGFSRVYDMVEYESLRAEYAAAGAFVHIYDKLGIVDGC